MDRPDHDQTFPRLQTQRLVLRRITVDDTEAIFRLFSDPSVARYLDFPVLQEIEEAEEIVAWCETIWEERSGGRWGIAEREEERLIGTCGFHAWAHRDARADIGYDLLPAYWGRGLMGEALTRIFEYGFQEMALHRIQAMVDPRNQRSQRLLERLGFVREGIRREWRFYKSRFWSEICYSLLESDPT